MKSMTILAAAAVVALGACGQRETVSRSATIVGPSFASGPMKTACLRSDRRQKSSALCGCIQAVADRSLSSRDQRLAASFFSDPHQAQVIRQSDNTDHERMWRSYKAFVGTAERTCRGL